MKTGTWGISHASHGDSAMTTRQPYPGACPHDSKVVTAVGPYAYQRSDGVFVVPIGCLKE